MKKSNKNYLTKKELIYALVYMEKSEDDKEKKINKKVDVEHGWEWIGPHAIQNAGDDGDFNRKEFYHFMLKFDEHFKLCDHANGPPKEEKQKEAPHKKAKE